MPSRSAASVTLVLRSAALAEAPPRLPLPPAPLPPLWSGDACAPPASSWLACEKHRCARCRAQGPDEDPQSMMQRHVAVDFLPGTQAC